MIARCAALLLCSLAAASANGCGAADSGAAPSDPAALERQDGRTDEQPARLAAMRMGEVPLNVVDLAASRGILWIASSGGGLLKLEAGRLARVADISNGLPSADVLQAEVDAAGRVVLGTAAGLALFDPVAGTIAAPVMPDDAPAGAADIVVASTARDLTIFQIAPEQRLESAIGGRFFALSGGVATSWRARLPGAAIATYGATDAGGCIMLYGVVAERVPSMTLWRARDCGDAPEAQTLAARAFPNAVGISAATSHPQTGAEIVAVVMQPGADPMSRRFALATVEAGELVEHCSRLRSEQPILGLWFEEDGALAMHRQGVGAETIGCAGAPTRSFGGGDFARQAHIIMPDPDLCGGLLMADYDRVACGGTNTDARLIAQTSADALPADAVQLATNPVGDRVLVSAPSYGVAELELAPSKVAPQRRWRPGAGLPEGVYGRAVYGHGDTDIVLAIRSRGLAALGRGETEFSPFGPDLLSPNILNIEPAPDGLWVAFRDDPLTGVRGGLQYVGRGASAQVPADEIGGAPNGDMIVFDDGRVWAASAAGVIEAGPTITTKRVSSGRVQGLFRNARTGQIASVGAMIQRWDGVKFMPLLFNIEDADRRKLTGHPIDVVIDDAGEWFVLYSGGAVLRFDRGGAVAGVLGPERFPPSAQSLLHVPAGDRIFVGSRREGLFELIRR